MSFSISRSSAYQRETYSALPTNERKTAVSLNTVLNQWNDKDEIKYHKPSDTEQTGYYYSDSQQPEGFLENGRRFLARLANPDARTLHSQSIDQVVTDLKAIQEHIPHAFQVEKDLKFRRILGQPIFVGAVKASLQQAAATSPNQKSSHPTPSINLFGEQGNREKKPLSSLFRRSSFPSIFSGKSGYQPIGGDDSTEPRILTSSAISYQSGHTEMRTLRHENFPQPIDAQQKITSQSSRLINLPTPQDGIPQQAPSKALSRYVNQRAEQKKSSGSRSFSSASPGSTVQGPPGSKNTTFNT